MRILYDSKSPLYKTPFGTLSEGESCRISLRIPLSCKTVKCHLCFQREDGREYAAFCMDFLGEEGEYGLYSAHFSLPAAGLFFYFFRIQTENETFSLFREGYDQTNMEAGELWQLSVIPSSFSTPADFGGKVMYQIFPDRFYQVGKCDLSRKLEPYFLHENKEDVPFFLPDETGEVRNLDFFGGNLQGISQKLDYLKDLGVGVVYLNPIFKAFSNHRYDTSDYKKIDEMLGTEEDFRHLCAEAHKRGIRIVLDGVFSHTGSDSLYFDAEERYGNGALHSPSSPYRSWFEWKENGEYATWWGIKTLPCVREMDSSYLDYIIRDEDSVVAHWLRAGADGFRLDVADELPDEFIRLLRQRLKEVKPDAILIGEVWEDASNKISYGKRRGYFTQGELDSVMNYPFRTAILNLVKGLDGGEAFRKSVMDLVENYPPQVLHHLMNMLSTHDTPRVLSFLSPTPFPEDKKDRAGFLMDEKDREIACERLFCAFLLQFVLPGMPCIYYGDEVGVEGMEDPFCRSFFPWNRVGESRVLPFLKTLSRLRKEDALSKGSLSVDTDGQGRIRLDRKFRGERIFAFLNLGEEASVSLDGETMLSRHCLEKDGRYVIQRYGFLLKKL